MALHFMTSNPQKLLNDFDSRIKQITQEGKITTWEKSEDGYFYTHRAREWAKKAWFTPRLSADRLSFHIVKPRDDVVSILTYAYYHSHLTETFLNNFDQDFTIASSTALPVAPDRCQN